MVAGQSRIRCAAVSFPSLHQPGYVTGVEEGSQAKEGALMAGEPVVLLSGPGVWSCKFCCGYPECP